jgi:competence protein ComEC
LKAYTQSIITYLQNQVGLQRDSLFLWIPVFVGIGIFIYFGYAPHISMPALLIITILMAAFTIIARCFYQRDADYHLLILFYLGMAISLVLSGITVSKIRSDIVTTPILQKDTFIEIEATIKKLSLLEGGKAKRVLLSDIDILDDSNIELADIRLKTYHFKGDEWNTGDRVRVTAKLMAPSPPVLPQGFDFRFKARFDRLSATGFTIKDAVLVNPATQSWFNVQSIRDAIAKNVYNVMQPRYAALSLALLTGERSGILKSDNEAMRASGLAHILAISGLHIGLVAGCMFFFVRLFLSIIPGLALRYPIKKWAAICAICVAFFYMVLAGATVPTLRAFIMTALVLIAVIMDRSALNLRLVAIAALFVMLTTPEAILGPSFQLSFAAVTALIAFYQGIGRRWFMNARAFHPAWRPIYYLAGVVVTTIIATLATAPFSIYFFNRFAAFSVLSNILAMPLMTFLVMPFGLLSMLAMPLGLSNGLLTIMEYGVQNIITIANAIASYPYADLYLPTIHHGQMAFIGFGFIWSVLWQGHLRWVGIVIMIIGILIAANTSYKRIFITDSANGVLITQTQNNDIYKSGRVGRYVTTQWLSSVGIHPKTKSEPIPKCDDFSCYVQIDDIRISLVHNKIILSSVCANSDIVIADFPIREWDECDQPRKIIDRFDVWKNGATIIDIDGNQIRVQTAQ